MRVSKGPLRVTEGGYKNQQVAMSFYIWRFFFGFLQRARNNPIGSTKIDMISRQILWKRILVAAVSSFVLIYICDYLSVRIRMIHPKPADPFESITIPRILAIPEKNGKIEYETDTQNPQQTITCVHSLFPHMGYSPCWYVKPRINQPIPM